MVTEASNAYFTRYNKHSLVGFEDFLVRAKQFATRRNEIAHGIVQPYFVSTLLRDGFALGPSRHATRKKKLVSAGDPHGSSVIDAYAYTSVEIEYFRTQFEKLANQAIQFMHDLLQIARLRRAASH
jgi:hypothetical protein